MMETCPVCGSMLVKPYGSESSSVLVVGEFPGKEEMKRGYPFVGQSGKILQSEFAKAGLDIWSCRLTNLWQHYKNNSVACFAYFVRELTIEMAGRKVLLMGSDLANYFIGGDVSKWYGLEVRSPLFPKSVQFVMMSPNPAICMRGTLGEFRMSVRKFISRVKGG